MNNIAILINTFKEREYFLDGYLYFLNKWNLNLPVYLSYDNIPYNLNENYKIDLKQYNYNFTKTNTFLGECKTWGHKLKTVLKEIKEDYIIFNGDDNWYRSINPNFYNVLDYMENLDADVIKLIPHPHQFKTKLNDDISRIELTSTEPWLLSHQISIWKKESLDKVVDYNDTACSNEKEGSNRCRNLQYKIFEYNYDVVTAVGINHVSTGIYDFGKEAVLEYEKFLNK